MSGRLLVPFSGTPACVAAIPVLARQHDAEVVALVLDLGQGQELEHLRDQALGAGAVRVHVLDVREEFARDYAVPSLHASEPGPGSDPFGARLAGVLVAKKMTEIARIEEATPVPDAIETTSTLWGRAGAYVWTRPATDAPESGAEVDITFDNGVPAAINGVPMVLTELIEILNIIAGHHAVGRLQLPGTFGEAPAAVVLHSAYRALDSAAGDAGAERVHGSVRVVLRKGRHTVVECQVHQTMSQR